VRWQTGRAGWEGQNSVPLWAAHRGSSKLTDIFTTVRAQVPLRLRAGLVKLLRRCLTQLTARARSYVDTCVRFEKEAAMQARRSRAGSAPCVPKCCRGQWCCTAT